MTSIDAHDPLGLSSQGSYDDSASSASHSLAHDSGFSSNVAKPNSTASDSYQSLQSRETRRSVNILGTLPMEISALIRSHSTSSRRHRPSQHDPAAQMSPEDERPTRNTKSQNRLYNFITRSLTRSRSRSQSRNGRVPMPDPDEPMPNIPKASSLASKPESRIKSRPISSTTTATNTTITPTNVHSKRPQSRTAEKATLSDRQSNPIGSSARRKLQNFFNLGSISRKSSSRPNSLPRQPLDKNAPLPPLPPEANYSSPSINTTPRPLRVLNADSRPTSPISGPLPLPSRNASASTTGSSNTNSSLKHRMLGGPKTPPGHSTDDVAGSSQRRSSTHHRRNSSSNSTSTYHSAVTDMEHSTSSAADISDSLAQVGLGPPRIIATPPTPSTPGGADKSLPLVPSSPSRRARFVDEFGELDGDKVGVLRSESTNGQPKSRLSTSTSGRRYSHSSKHGSFDFERPGGWNTGIISMQRSTSGGSSESGHTVSPPTANQRDSAMGPGLAGVGTLQRDISVRRAKEREELVAKAKEEERRRRAAEKRNGEPEKHVGTKLDRHRSLQASHRTHSPSMDKNHAPGEKTGSWGKRRGGPFSHSTTSKGRLLSVGITHGAFPFEPAVHSPTWSANNSTGSARDAAITSSWGGGDKVKLAREKDAAKSLLGSSSSHGHGSETDKKPASIRSGDRPPVPVPGISPGHRSGLKGRSLDLGLGLSWAATSIPGDSLLSSAFFTRQTSGTSSQNGHATPPIIARQESTSEKDGKPIGGEVAAMFKKVLDEQSYARFIAYVNQWDAKQIDFDGQTGIVAKADELLAKSPHLTEDARKQLLSRFVKLILRSM